MKIYTRTGDSGETSLVCGRGAFPSAICAWKPSARSTKLNAQLGLARAFDPSPQVDAWLEQAQNQLFHLGADIAAPLDAKSDWITRIGVADIHWLEGANRPNDGSVAAAAQLHFAGRLSLRGAATGGAGSLSPRRTGHGRFGGGGGHWRMRPALSQSACRIGSSRWRAMRICKRAKARPNGACADADAGGGESNPHTRRYTSLSRARLPIPPLRPVNWQSTPARACCQCAGGRGHEPLRQLLRPMRQRAGDAPAHRAAATLLLRLSAAGLL